MAKDQSLLPYPTLLTQHPELLNIALLQHVSCGVILHERNGNINWLNTFAKKILGSKAKDAIGQPLTHVISNQDQACATARGAFNPSNTANNHGLIIQADNSSTHINYMTTYIDSGTESFLLTIIENTTSECLLHKQLLLNDKLATVGLLSAGIIHEINNPLTWISQNMNYLKNSLLELQEMLPEKAASLAELEGVIDDTQDGLHHICQIVKDVKGFARVDEEKDQLVNIHEALQLAITMTRSTYKNVASYQCHFHAELPALSLTTNRLPQVFLNLLVNAMQAFTAPDINQNKITLHTDFDSDHVTIQIADNGIGIAANYLQKIFDPFYTTKSTGQGSGLGLPITKNIIESLGGSLGVESQLGLGTTFTITLPRAKR
jgi:two-component system NtrC family sensor kinase